MSEQASHTPGEMYTRRASSPIDGAFDFALVMVIAGREYVVAEAFGRVDVNVLTPAEENALRIALSWNCHDELLEACKKASTCASLPDAVRGLLRAAITKAQGGAQ